MNLEWLRSDRYEEALHFHNQFSLLKYLITHIISGALN